MTPSGGGRLLANLAPARLLSGVKIEHVAPDGRAFTVALRPRWFRGGEGTAHTGAALYAMVDPFLVRMVQQAMGEGYLVWDKAGSIEILAPAHGRVWVRAELPDDHLRHMRAMTESGDKHLHLFAVDVRDAEGMAVARVEKMIYVRRRGKPV